MKKLVLIFTIIFSLALFPACERDLVEEVLDIDQSSAPVITNPTGGSTFDLEDYEPTAPVTTIEWSPVQYSLAGLSNPRYVVHIDVAGNGFAGARDLAASEGTSVSVTQAQLNQRLRALELEAGVAHDVEIRVFASINDNAVYENLTSAPVTFTVIPYEVPEPEPALLWVPGAYQEWNPGAAPNVYSPLDDGMYRGYVYMAAGEFKFTSQPNWEGPNYGNGGPGLLDTDPGASNLSVPTGGTWYFTVNTDALTWTSQLRNFALIGSFNDWAADAPLTWFPEERVFKITLDLAAGAAFKWRANGEWTINLGTSSEAGVLTLGGGDLTVETAGNYTIVLDLYAVNPTYEIIAN